MSKEERRSFPPLRLDFLIETLSARDSRAVLEKKMLAWIANGAQLAWMIDPYAGTPIIYRPGAAPKLLLRPDSVEADDVVPGFRLSTRLLWES